jgi:hypothetical protein
VVIALTASVAAGCGSRRGRGGAVPVERDLPPLPEAVELCISKAVVLPGKLDGRPWDGVGRADRDARKLIPHLAAAASTGGYSAALSAAGTVGAAVFNKVKGPPDLRVRVQIGRDHVIRSRIAADGAIAAFASDENNCAVIERKEYDERIQLIVDDMDVGKPELAGTTSFIGIPPEAILEGTWLVTGFDQVVELGFTMQPMQKPAAPRPALPPEPAPASGDTGDPWSTPTPQPGEPAPAKPDPARPDPGEPDLRPIE